MPKAISYSRTIGQTLIIEKLRFRIKNAKISVPLKMLESKNAMVTVYCIGLNNPKSKLSYQPLIFNKFVSLLVLVRNHMNVVINMKKNIFNIKNILIYDVHRLKFFRIILNIYGYLSFLLILFSNRYGQSLKYARLI